MAKKEKTKNYPANVKTEVAKRLFDQGLIMTPEAIKLKQGELLARRKAEAQTKITKGYIFNPFSNRKERRAAAKRGGFLPKDWRMYRTTTKTSTEAPQTVVNAT